MLTIAPYTSSEVEGKVRMQLDVHGAMTTLTLLHEIDMNDLDLMLLHERLVNSGRSQSPKDTPRMESITFNFVLCTDDTAASSAIRRDAGPRSVLHQHDPGVCRNNISFIG